MRRQGPTADHRSRPDHGAGGPRSGTMRRMQAPAFRPLRSFSLSLALSLLLFAGCDDDDGRLPEECVALPSCAGHFLKDAGAKDAASHDATAADVAGNGDTAGNSD